ncbi:hypothetical protein [Luteimonas sp. TWI1416]|uniref:hypothetical protein n=1 Tax=unclassified Luteimonas TaxID=2629088 RepID=UPI0032085700
MGIGRQDLVRESRIGDGSAGSVRERCLQRPTCRPIAGDLQRLAGESRPVGEQGGDDLAEVLHRDELDRMRAVDQRHPSPLVEPSAGAHQHVQEGRRPHDGGRKGQCADVGLDPRFGVEARHPGRYVADARTRRVDEVSDLVRCRQIGNLRPMPHLVLGRQIGRHHTEDAMRARHRRCQDIGIVQ